MSAMIEGQGVRNARLNGLARRKTDPSLFCPICASVYRAAAAFIASAGPFSQLIDDDTFAACC
jgi:hypothetical protein